MCIRDRIDTPPIHIKAGPQKISAAFVPRSIGPVDDLMTVSYTHLTLPTSDLV